MTLRSAATLAIVLLASACATDRPFTWVQELPLPDDSQQQIGPRDTIAVDVHNQPALSGEFVVSEAGDYRQPTVGTVPVEGKTAAAVSKDLEERLKGVLVKPEVTVSIARSAPVRVNVVGEVRTPGSFELVRGRSVLSALAAAGWLTEFANKDRVFVLRTLPSEARIRFRTRELTAAEPHAARFRLRDGDVVVVE